MKSSFFARLKVGRMRLGRFVGSGMLALVVLLGLPVQAAAQFTLTGQLLEQLPGGGTLQNPYFYLARVEATGDTSDDESVYECQQSVTTNCIRSDGTFTILDLQPGLYLLELWTFRTHINKSFNVSISGNTDIGIVPLVRAPFDVEVTMGQIPSSGGSIPLTVRVRTRWDIPTLPVTADFWVEQDGVDGEAFIVKPSIDFTWPAGLADSGVVPLAPIDVGASAPAGAQSCASVRIVVRNRPDLVLGEDWECRGKQP